MFIYATSVPKDLLCKRYAKEKGITVIQENPSGLLHKNAATKM
jgi:hypothetical protein